MNPHNMSDMIRLQVLSNDNNLLEKESFNVDILPGGLKFMVTQHERLAIKEMLQLECDRLQMCDLWTGHDVTYRNSSNL